MNGIAKKAFTHDPSATGAFKALGTAPSDERPLHETNAVVIGGGTGAPMSIRTLLSMDVKTSAVVAMADDGGSTGILRDQAGATAPGDIRKCITAMAGNPDDALTKAFKVRFRFAENHTLGNLMLSALEATSGSFPEAIQVCEKLLDARGKVYPSTLDRVTLIAQTMDGRTLEGQAVACHSRCALKRVALHSDSKILAYEPAMDAIKNADMIVLGPGSLFTSIIPNLLVPGIVEAIRASRGTRVFVCSLADMQGETRGMSPLEHYKALCAHGMEGLVDVMLAQAPVRHNPNHDTLKRLLEVNDEAAREIEAHGTAVMAFDLVDAEHPTWHDPVKLRHAFSEVLKTCRSARM